MRTEFFCLPNNSQVIRVRGAAAPRVFLTRITCFSSGDNPSAYIDMASGSPSYSPSMHMSECTRVLLSIIASRGQIPWMFIRAACLFSVIGSIY